MIDEEKKLALETISELKRTLIKQKQYASTFSTLLNQSVESIRLQQNSLEKGLNTAERIIEQYEPRTE